MKIWITRHGQTALNKQKLMQGLTDEPLNETGIQQAKKARKRLKIFILMRYMQVLYKERFRQRRLLAM